MTAAAVLPGQRSRAACPGAPLVDHAGDRDRDRALSLYQTFKRDDVATWRSKVWAADPAEVESWLGTAPVEATA